MFVHLSLLSTLLALTSTLLLYCWHPAQSQRVPPPRTPSPNIDTLCGGNYPQCTSQTITNTKGNIWCYTGGCQDATLTAWLNIICVNDYSCQGAKINSSDDPPATQVVSSIYCLGTNSCQYTTLFSPDDDIYCDGLNSCLGATIRNLDDDIYCQGDRSCAGATVIADDDNIYCNGYTSCQSAKLYTYDDDIACNGASSCYHTTAYAMEYVNCTVYGACSQMTITYVKQANGVQRQTLICTVDKACTGMTVTCTANPGIPCYLDYPSKYPTEKRFTLYSDNQQTWAASSPAFLMDNYDEYIDYAASYFSSPYSDDERLLDIAAIIGLSMIAIVLACHLWGTRRSRPRDWKYNTVPVPASVSDTTIALNAAGTTTTETDV